MRRKIRREVLGLFTLAILLAGGLILFARLRDNTKPRSPYQFPVQELAALDGIVQTRFAFVPTEDFGMARIGKRHAVFKPLTAKEKNVIADLQKKKMDVVFYVAGREFLTQKLNMLGERNYLQGPVFITEPGKNPKKQTPYSYDTQAPGSIETSPMPDNLPGGKDPVNSPLKPLAKKAYDAFNTSDGMNLTAGDWKIVARPVRASKETCVDCHNYMVRPRALFGTKWVRMGDTLGVAMYAYRVTFVQKKD